MDKAFNRGILFALGAVLIWGVWPVMTAYAMRSSGFQALDLSFLRFGIGGVFLLPFILKDNPTGRDWAKSAFIGIGTGAPYMFLAMTAINYAPVSHAGIVNPAAFITLSVFGGALLLGETLNKQKFIGFTLVILGLYLLGPKSLDGAGQAALFGDFLLLCAGGIWATAALAIKGWNVDVLATTARAALISGLIMTPFFLAGYTPALYEAPWQDILLHGFWQGIMTAVIAMTLFSRATQYLGAGKAAMVNALTPALAALSAYLFIDEQLSLQAIFGVLSICTGILVTVLRMKKPAATVSPASQSAR